MVNHIHLDLVGGLSGDMFISSMLDAFPQFKQGLGQVINDAGFPDLVELETLDHDDGTLTGTRFTVNAVEQEGHHQHQHRHYSDIRGRLQDANLNKVTRDNALEIFRLIAEVEAAIHGKKVEDVAFHEVGAWDSIADIGGAFNSLCGCRFVEHFCDTGRQRICGDRSRTSSCPCACNRTVIRGIRAV